MQIWINGRYHRIICKDYESKESIHRGKERIKEHYSGINIGIWHRDLNMK